MLRIALVMNHPSSFPLAVADAAARRLGRRVSLLYAGNGEQDEEVMREAACRSECVEVNFHGPASQQELPALYASARTIMTRRAGVAAAGIIDACRFAFGDRRPGRLTPAGRQWG